MLSACLGSPMLAQPRALRNDALVDRRSHRPFKIRTASRPSSRRRAPSTVAQCLDLNRSHCRLSREALHLIPKGDTEGEDDLAEVSVPEIAPQILGVLPNEGGRVVSVELGASADAGLSF
jgi:hypothetical protein